MIFKKYSLLFLLLFVFSFTLNAQKSDNFDLETYLANDFQNRLNRVNDYLANNGNDQNIKEGYCLYDVEDGKPIYMAVDNKYSARTLNAQQLYSGGSAGLNLSGAGLYVGVWDGGKIRTTHQEFTNRITTNIPNSISNHATHVSGTIMAEGIDANAKGIAYGANVLGYSFVSSTGGPVDEFSQMNNAAGGSYEMKISNHSYGLVASSISQYYFGAYTSNSKNVDLVANDNPNYLIVVAAGNDRDNTSVPQVQQKGGYDLLSGLATSKNGLTVGAINQVLNYSGPSSVVMSSFSNWGPTDDGRIKPDCVAKGTAVYSTYSSSDTSYGYEQGTSMSTPAISGLCALLQQHYHNENAQYMWASTLKGLILHTTREAGSNPGPDYAFGWGLPDAVKAAEVITNANNEASLMEQNNLASGASYSQTVNASGTEPLVVSICWNDPAGFLSNAVVDNPSPVLRNDLDVKVVQDGVTYFPWKLDVANPSAAATKNSTNDVDNFEKVEIENPSGNYTIEITHKGNLVGGSQDYSLIVSGGYILGVEDVDKTSNTFEIYPNPVGAVLNIKSDEDLTGSSATIYNSIGQIELTTKIQTNNQLEVSNLNPGNYVLVIQNGDNKSVKKFIKQ